MHIKKLILELNAATNDNKLVVNLCVIKNYITGTWKRLMCFEN